MFLLIHSIYSLKNNFSNFLNGFSSSNADFWAYLPLFFCVLISHSASAQATYADLQKQVVEVFEQRHNSVVRIKAQKVQEIDPVVGDKPRLRLTIGSGFFVSGAGHVLTNSSLVMGMDKILVQYQKDLEFPAEVVGIDRFSNIALLKISALPKTASFVNCSVHMDQMPPIGQMAIAITCPLQFSPSPTLGLVSGHESTIGSRPFPTPILRMNIDSLPGDSGSPLFDLDGKFMGMSVATIKEIQSTCVFPAKATHRILKDLMENGQVQYGTIGLRVVQKSDPEFGPRLVVTEAIPGKVAAKAGLKKDDLIYASNAGPIRTLGDLQRAIFFTTIGDALILKISRQGKFLDISVPVEKLQTQTTSGEDSSPSNDGS